LTAVVINKDGQAKTWWKQQSLTESELRIMYREKLAKMIESLLTNEADINAYIKIIRHIGARRSGERKKHRRTLYDAKCRNY